MKTTTHNPANPAAPARRLSTLMACLAGGAVLALAGCSSMKTPATADVAVSRAAVDNAASAGAVELAPDEMASARDKMARANQALADKNYPLAKDLADQAQADAKLAQSKANSAKATAAADAVNDNIRVLRDELNRANAASQPVGTAPVSAN